MAEARKRPTAADLRTLWAIKETGTVGGTGDSLPNANELRRAGLWDWTWRKTAHLTTAGEWLIANNRSYSGVQT